MEKYQELLIPHNISIKNSMKVLDTTSSRILFITDDSGVLIGTVTDGDIRRAILNNIGFDQPVSVIMCKNPFSVRRSQSRFEERARNLVIEEKAHAVPVTDDLGRVTDVLFWYDFFESHPHEIKDVALIGNRVVVMAGGKGERLDPFTKILPKPLIPFDGKPILEQIMDNFHKHGFVNFSLTLNYKKEIIKMYLKESRFPYSVDWVEEEEYLGTAGSLRLLKDKLKDTFFVCNCDVLLTYDFKRILAWHKSEKALVTLVGCHKEIVIPYGTIDVSEGQLKSFNEKPSFDVIINTGIYVMEPSVADLISPNEHIDMNHLLERAQKLGRVTVYPVASGWYDIGQWKEYRDSLLLLQDSGCKKI